MDKNYPRPHLLSITQSTEAGKVFTPEELLSIKSGFMCPWETRHDEVEMLLHCIRQIISC
ncbi:MAG: hypothetical protein GX556_05975 [Fibrobacter sp.]|nr:hypothetical protein [Fibrobacter sp.]